MLYDGSPCFKLGLMAANFAILDATRDYSKIHIVDFDLGQGGQYASLINSIAERSRHRLSPPFVKITAVCDPTFPFNTLITVNNLNIIGDKITRLAERFGITVKFNVLNWRMTELDRSVLGCEPGEALAVNFAFVLSRIADESVSPANPRDQLLRRVKSLEPSVELGPGVSEPVKLRFGSMKANPGFTCKEEGGRLGFGWMGRVLVMVSAWR
ncbi:uncharacterized protein A4U43_C04F24140 [Asparagus officinalis]|uniref:Uncharacterized protein n=1 Tax=Asparagus officinalis TaxID=4686 RepID=A0A5P1F3B7_ASPOF|nr:uncharacterized protein A4U43_C04F24140 [Asparagus officinalis]